MLHINCCNSTQAYFSKYLKLPVLRLHKIGGKNGSNWPKINLFNFFLKSWYMEEYRKCKNSWMVTHEFLQMNSNSAKSTFSKIFKSWRPHFQKWVVKSDQTFSKIWLALTLITLLRSKIPQNIHKSQFSFNRKKINWSSLFVSNFSFVCYLLYKLYSRTYW